MGDFFCDLFNWGCEQHGEFVTRNAAPEISGDTLTLALALVIGVLMVAWPRKVKR